MTDLFKPETTVAESAPRTDPMQLLEMAISNKVDADSMERLTALAERFQDRQAQQALNAALHQFQELCPTLEKTMPVYDRQGNLMYNYIPFDKVKETIQPLLKECGLVFRHSVREKSVVCTVTHRDGASIDSEFPLTQWDGGKMNSSQRSASGVSFAKRYSLFGALAIATFDDDARAAHDNPNADPNAPNAQPRGERVNKSEVERCMSEWKTSNGGDGGWIEFTEFVRQTCGLSDSLDLNDPHNWTQKNLTDCFAELERIMS